MDTLKLACAYQDSQVAPPEGRLARKDNQVAGSLCQVAWKEMVSLALDTMAPPLPPYPKAASKFVNMNLLRTAAISPTKFAKESLTCNVTRIQRAFPQPMYKISIKTHC